MVFKRGTNGHQKKYSSLGCRTTHRDMVEVPPKRGGLSRRCCHRHYNAQTNNLRNVEVMHPRETKPSRVLKYFRHLRPTKSGLKSIIFICVCFLFGDHSTILTSCLMPRRKARWLSLAAWASGSLQRWLSEFIIKKRGFFSSQNHFIVFFHEQWLLGTLPHLGYKRGSDGYNLVRGVNQFSLSVRSCHSAENMVKSGIHCRASRPTRLDTCSAKCWPLSEAPRVQLHLGFTSLREVVCRMA